MEAFDIDPPEWVREAVHAVAFCCPACQASPLQAERVWINRRSPVYTEYNRRKWQEFYYCECGRTWWGWSSDSPPSPLGEREVPSEDPYEDL
ncbi:MAG: hypothetical protein HC925_04575 [Coleofasciculaceae cyanobacterium SM2_3_26]|nr:hypothetical protein [Coleofasciculaceae cyanobacterium SM2_3_26]